MLSDEISFSHECVAQGCTRIIDLDDEPWCFEHSPDEGSALIGYSARRAAEMRDHADSIVSRNVFEKSPPGKNA